MFLVLASDAEPGGSRCRIHRWSIQATPTGAASIDPNGHSLFLATRECLADREDADRLVVCGASGHHETDLAHLHGLARALDRTNARVTAHKGLWGESLSSGVAAAAVAACCLEEATLAALPGVCANALRASGLEAVTPENRVCALCEALVAGVARGGAAAARLIGRP